MEKSIQSLNLNTSLKNSGQKTNPDAMNHFFKLVISHLNDKDEYGKDVRSADSKYNMLANMLCFDKISPALKLDAETRMMEIDREHSLINLQRQESTIINDQEVTIKR